MTKRTALEKQWRLVAYLQEPSPRELGYDMNDPEDRALYEHEIDIVTARLMGRSNEEIKKRYFRSVVEDLAK